MSVSPNHPNIVVDAKWRLMIPAKYRPILLPECQMYLDDTNCLALMPLDQWRRLLDHMGKQRSMYPEDDKIEAAFDRTYHFSDRLRIDGSTGRFVLPAILRPECDLTPGTEAVFIGRADRVSLMSRARYDREFEQRLRSPEVLEQQRILTRALPPLDGIYA